MNSHMVDDPESHVDDVLANMLDLEGGNAPKKYIHTAYGGPTIHIPTTNPFAIFSNVTDETLYEKELKSIETFFKRPVGSPDVAQMVADEVQAAVKAVQQARDQARASAQPTQRTSIPDHNVTGQDQRQPSRARSLFGGANIIRTSADIEREYESNLGMAIWQLMNLSFTIDWDTGKLSNPRKTPWSNSMQRFADLPASARNARITSIIFIFFNTKMPAGLASDPRVTQMSMKVFPKAFISSLMSRNFQTKPLDSILQEPTSLNMLHVGKQNRKERVQKAKEDQKKVDNENMQFCPEGQRKNIKSKIGYLSRIGGVIDASYMLSNFMNMERVFFI